MSKVPTRIMTICSKLEIRIPSEMNLCYSNNFTESQVYLSFRIYIERNGFCKTQKKDEFYTRKKRNQRSDNSPNYKYRRTGINDELITILVVVSPQSTFHCIHKCVYACVCVCVCGQNTSQNWTIRKHNLSRSRNSLPTTSVLLCSNQAYSCFYLFNTAAYASEQCTRVYSRWGRNIHPKSQQRDKKTIYILFSVQFFVLAHCYDALVYRNREREDYAFSKLRSLNINFSWVDNVDR